MRKKDAFSSKNVKFGAFISSQTQLGGRANLK